MNRIPIVVGLDYHTHSVQVAIMKASDTPQLLANESLPNDPLAIQRFVESFGTVQRCGIEACTGAADLAEQLLVRAGWPVDLAHPGIASRMKHNPDKSNYADSRILADLARVGYLPKVWLAPAYLRELRLVVRDRTNLARQRRRIRQQIGALLREHRLTSPHRRWSRPWLLWLKDVALPAPSRWLVERQQERLQYVAAEITRVEAYLTEITCADPLVQRLRSLRGIGAVTAWILRAFVGSFERFKNGKQLARYCGLSPRNASSGTRQADAGLVRLANADLRSALIEVAWCLIRYSPRWKALAQRLRAHGKPGSVVAAAVANRFVRSLWSHMKTAPGPR